MMITKIIEKLFYRFRKRRTNGVKKVACWLLLSWFLKIFRLLFYSIVYQCEITVHWLCFALHLSLSRQLKWNSRVLLPAVQVACLSLFHVEEFSISFKYVRCCPCQPAQKKIICNLFVEWNENLIGDDLWTKIEATKGFIISFWWSAFKAILIFDCTLSFVWLMIKMSF